MGFGCMFCTNIEETNSWTEYAMLTRRVAMIKLYITKCKFNQARHVTTGVDLKYECIGEC